MEYFKHPLCLVQLLSWHKRRPSVYPKLSTLDRKLPFQCVLSLHNFVMSPEICQKIWYAKPTFFSAMINDRLYKKVTSFSVFHKFRNLSILNILTKLLHLRKISTVSELVWPIMKNQYCEYLVCRLILWRENVDSYKITRTRTRTDMTTPWATWKE